MKLFLNIGKAAGVLFWGVVLANLAGPFAQPFDLLLNLAGGGLLALHVLELMLFKARWQAQPAAALHAVQILLFGIFHLLCLPQALAKVEEPAAEPVAAGVLEVEHA
ncbi:MULTISPECIES: DUF1145 domain-containing protein [unclassified Pseudomonas]|uniref:DUF1145 domain-containing protein n=1 Tax=unclassified Pseudomonas TaxID=196821 RepID=UPI00244B84F4|nr:DUF1145 domain-containing protein [Pseudomonas sp. GD03944]MDH1264657.1 DUF1145 domain-containing protein [Pseudomonas sp. GD03944]